MLNHTLHCYENLTNDKQFVCVIFRNYYFQLDIVKKKFYFENKVILFFFDL